MKKIGQIFLFAFLITSASNTFAKGFQSEILKASNKKTSGEYVRKQFVSLMGKTFEKSSKKKLLVFGDSHAQDFINMAFEGGHLKDYQVKTRNMPTACQPILTSDYEKYIDRKSKDICKKSDSLKAAQAQIEKADILILAANWKEWSAKELPNTIKNLKLRKDQKLYIIGRKNFGKINIRKLVRKSKEALLSINNAVDSRQVKITNIMEGNVDKSVYVDFQNIICKQKDKCPIFTKNVKLISFDGGHLTRDGAKYLGDRLFSESILKNL